MHQPARTVCPSLAYGLQVPTSHLQFLDQDTHFFAACSLLGFSGNCLWSRRVIFPKFLTSLQFVSSDWLVLGCKGPVLLCQHGIFIETIPTPKILVRSAETSTVTV